MKQLNCMILMFALTTAHAWAGLEGISNTAYGQYAGANAGDNDDSVFIGRSAGFNNTTGYANAFLGFNAGGGNSTGSLNTFLGASAGAYNTTASNNTFIGNSAGFFNTGGNNTFLGVYAGFNNTTASYNTFIGGQSGYNTTTGFANTFLGHDAGNRNTTGGGNTYLGNAAGFSNVAGYGNVFIGNTAGYYETGFNKLYIDNSATATPLIYGEFDNKKVTLNGNLEVVGPNAGIVRLTDVTTDATTKGARLVLSHYNNASLPVYLFGAASTPSQNFVAFGGGNAIGNAATQLDFFTAPNTTTAAGTSRMTITGNGNVGMGFAAPIYPLQMASGALVTAGGVWTNASSREYKENIESLTTQEAVITLAALDPVTYNYKADKEQVHVGFIAEDVPELVATKDRKGLSPMDMVAVLTKVVQAQQRAMQEQERMDQEQQKNMHAQQKSMESYQKRAEEQERFSLEQQQIIAELREQNKSIAEQTKLIPLLSATLGELKQEIRMERTTAQAE